VISIWFIGNLGLIHDLVVRDTIDFVPRTHNASIVVTDNGNEISFALDFVDIFKDRRDMGALLNGVGRESLLCHILLRVVLNLYRPVSILCMWLRLS
jgi:hypothetical protein